jgi:hypothetical protein
MTAGIGEIGINKMVIFENAATAIGGAGGSSLVCANLPATEDFNGQLVILSDHTLSGPRIIVASTTGGTIIPDSPFDAQIPNGTEFIIFANRIPASVIKSALSADQAVNITAILGSETTLLNLNTVPNHYTVAKLRLKSADPGAGNSVNVRLYELVNAVLTQVDSFVITSPGDSLPNPSTGYYSLMDCFGLQYLTGDNLMVTVRQQVGGGPTAITGSWNYKSG